MPTRLIALSAVGLFAALLTGCSGTPPAKADPLDVTVTVTLSKGGPGKDLNLMLLPTSSGQLQGGGKTDASGKVKTKLTPGQYTFAFDGNPAGVPKKYHSNDANHKLDVTNSTTELEIKLTD